MIIPSLYSSSARVSRSGRKASRLLPRVALTLAGFALLHGTAHAAAPNWKVAGNGSWNTAANWSTGIVPVAGDTVTFNLSTAYAPETITLDANQAAGTITFTNTGTTSIIGSTTGTNPYTLTVGGTAAYTTILSDNAGAGAVTVGGGNMSIVVAAPTATGSLYVANNSSNLLTLAANIAVYSSSTVSNTLSFNGTNNTTVTGAISNGSSTYAANISKTGTGTLTLQGTNSYTGTTLVSGGTLVIDASNGGSLGTTALTYLNSGTIELLGATSGTTSQTLGGVSVTTGGVGGIIANGNTSTSTSLNFALFSGLNPGSSLNITTLNNGSVTTTQGNNLNTGSTGGILSPRIILNGTDFAAISTSATSGTANPIGAATTTVLTTTASTDTNNSVVSDSGSTVALAGNRTTNSLTVRTGGGALTVPTGNTLTLTSGGLLFTGTSNYSITGGSIASGPTVAASGNTGTYGGELLVTQNSTGNVTIGSTVSGSGIAFTKAGPGSLTLSAANTYTGTTYINNGTLNVTNTTGSATGTGPVALDAGAGLVSTLASGAGSVGIISGTVTANGKTTSVINPGGIGTVGMLTLANLTATTGATIDFDLGATSDRLAVTGTLTGTTTAGALLFNFSNLGATAGTTYTLVTYGAATNVTTTELSYSGPAGFTGTFSLGTNAANEIDFTVTAVPEPSTLFGAVATTLMAAGAVYRRVRARA